MTPPPEAMKWSHYMNIVFFTPTAAPISAVRPSSSPMLSLTSAPWANAAAMATRSPSTAARYRRQPAVFPPEREGRSERTKVVRGRGGFGRLTAGAHESLLHVLLSDPRLLVGSESSRRHRSASCATSPSGRQAGLTAGCRLSALPAPPLNAASRRSRSSPRFPERTAAEGEEERRSEN